MSVNKVFLMGRLGGDPEVKMTQGGQQVATMSIATSEKWTGKDGQKQEKTTWHRVVMWGKMAELAGRYLKKGREVHIEGKLDNRSWDDQNGQKRYVTEIVATDMTFVGSNGGDGQQRQQQQGNAGHSSHSNDDWGPSDSDVPF